MRTCQVAELRNVADDELPEKLCTLVVSMILNFNKIGSLRERGFP